MREENASSEAYHRKKEGKRTPVGVEGKDWGGWGKAGTDEYRIHLKSGI